MVVLWTPAEEGEPRCGHTVTRHGDYAYVVGGFSQDSSASDLTVAVMDLKSKVWLKNVDADVGGNDNRAGHTTVVMGNKFYIYGGEVVGGRSGELADTVLCCDINPSAIVFEEVAVAPPKQPDLVDGEENPAEMEDIYADAGPPPCRAWHAACAIQNLPDMSVEIEEGAERPTRPTQMLVFAGQDSDYSALDDLWLMDSSTGWWTNAKTSGEAPAARAYHSVSYLDNDKGQVAVFGGAGGDGERYPQDGISLHLLQTLFPGADPGADVVGVPQTFVWTGVRTAGPSPSPRCWHAALMRQQVLSPEEYESKMSRREEVRAQIEEESGGSGRSPSRNSNRGGDQDGGAEADGDEAPKPDSYPHHSLIVFGGHATEGSLPPTTYSLDLLTLEWEEMAVAKKTTGGGQSAVETTTFMPGARYGHGSVMTSDSDENVAVFGGMADKTSPNDGSKDGGGSGGSGSAKSGEVLWLDLHATDEEIAQVSGGAQLGWSKHTYADGGVYEGMFRGDEREGKGEMTYPNGDRYTGDWQGDVRCGTGRCTYGACGSVYEGDWADDVKAGEGTMRYNEGPMTGLSDGPMPMTGTGAAKREAKGTVERDYTGAWVDGERHGYGVCTYVNGDRYEGDWSNGLKDGRGDMHYGNGDLYKGTWTGGKCSGAAGWLRKRNGDVYEGPFKVGKMTGEGVCNYHDGSVYTGTFKQGMCNGSGVCQYANRDVYEGKWRANRRNGKGECRYANGDVYNGTWADDVKSGVGTCKYRNGDVYDGGWADGQRHGTGRHTARNGTTYDGDWQYGVRSGQGDCLYYVGHPPERGDEYTGSWEGDVRSGKGTLTATNGDVYEGMFEADVQAGQGKLTYADGSIYDGEWRAGRQDGRGILETAEGREPARYEGEFREGVAEGTGVATYTSGDRYDGEFSRGTDKSMLVARHGEGECRYRNGDVYDGQWQNDKRMGTGTQTFATGEVYEGEWKFDVRHVRRTNWKQDDWDAKEAAAVAGQ